MHTRLRSCTTSERGLVSASPTLMWSSNSVPRIDAALRLGLCKPKLHFMHGLYLVPWGHVICMMLMA